MGSQCIQVPVDIGHICTVNIFLHYTKCWINQYLWKLIWRICLSVWLIQNRVVQKHNEKQSLFCLITFVPYVHLLSWNGDCVRLSSLLYRIVWNCVKGFWQVFVVTVELKTQSYISFYFWHCFLQEVSKGIRAYFASEILIVKPWLLQTMHEVLSNSKQSLWNLMVEQNHTARCQGWGIDTK